MVIFKKSGKYSAHVHFLQYKIHFQLLQKRCFSKKRLHELNLNNRST